MKGKIKDNYNAIHFTQFLRQQYEETAKVLYQSIDTRYRFKPPKLATKNQHASRNKFVVITRYKITISVGDSGSHTFPFVVSQKFEYSIDTVIIHIVHFTQVFFLKCKETAKLLFQVNQHTT